MEDETFIDIMKETKLPIEDINFIKENTEGLTREGVEYCIKMWKLSRNKYQIEKFTQMLKHCKKFEASGKTSDGKTIMSRRDGKISWAEQV